MNKRILASLAGALLAAGLCGFAQAKGAAPLKIAIRDLQGSNVGAATFSEVQGGGVKLELDIAGLPPGNHVFHIHQKPTCDPKEEFNTAGLQFDPTGEMYGNAEHHARSGPAAGDPHMGVDVGRDGVGHASVVFPKLTLSDDARSIVSGGGRAIVFHAAAGADGPTRIACGVIAR
jgi:Cu-Zn family superoxide dismutase